MVNSSASTLSSSSQPLSARLVAGRHMRHRADRRAQQEQRAVGEQHEDRGPARHQRFVPAAPEFIGRRPGIGGDDPGADQHAQFGRRGEYLQAAGQQPDRDANERQRRLRVALIEHTRAAPGQREGAEQHRIGEIDRKRIRHRAVLAKQHDRDRAQQMGAAPPGERALAEVLRPGEKQQQAEHDLDVHRHQEKCVDVEVHGDQSKRDAGVFRHRHKLRRPRNTRCKAGLNAGLIAVARLAKPFPVRGVSPPDRTSRSPRIICGRLPLEPGMDVLERHRL